ncbi:MAG: FAD-dependent oxidoreductase [Acidimicrobiia bacterium]|nr:FAD-dependent oxidoreductase [Acidimicrobiia bacterium]
MAEIVVIGAGIGGSAAALLLARDGHSVTVLERDGGPLARSVDEAWSSWNRRAVSQFRLAHILLPRGGSILSDELPDVAARLELAGGLHLDPIDGFLRQSGTPRRHREPDDDRFTMLTGRRSTIEWVLAVTLEIGPSISVRRGVAVDSLIAGSRAAPGTPHVAGVRLDSGEEIAADLVVDATGRNSPTVRWLSALGAIAPHEVVEDSGFAYYCRFFASADGTVPELRAPILTPFGSMSVLTIPSDNGTWAIMLYASSTDKLLRRFRQPEVFESVVRQCPLHAHWLDGEPISEMASMVGVSDRKRTFLVDDQPVVTGMLSIGDAAACSNPSLGRGMSFALMHTVLLRDMVRKHLDDPVELAREFGRQTELEIGPWYDETRRIDRSRIEEMRAIADGREVEDTPQRRMAAAFDAAANSDLTVFRARSEIMCCLTRADEVLSRDGLLEHAIEVAGTAVDPPPGPDRARLGELVS